MSAIRDSFRAIAYGFRWLRFVAVEIIPNRPVTWVDVADGSEEREHMRRSIRYHALRPMFYGFLNNLDCGCTRRFGRIVLFRMDCDEHMGDLTSTNSPGG